MLFDIDGGGHIDADELEAVVHALGRTRARVVLTGSSTWDERELWALEDAVPRYSVDALSFKLLLSLK